MSVRGGEEYLRPGTGLTKEPRVLGPAELEGEGQRCRSQRRRRRSSEERIYGLPWVSRAGTRDSEQRGEGEDEEDDCMMEKHKQEAALEAVVGSVLRSATGRVGGVYSLSSGSARLTCLFVC